MPGSKFQRVAFAVITAVVVSGAGMVIPAIAQAPAPVASEAAGADVEGIAAFIVGPSLVNWGAWCMWFADVAGGTPPYQYSWYGGAASSSDPWTSTQVIAGFTLFLVVTDSNGLSDGTSLNVQIDPNGQAPECAN